MSKKRLSRDQRRKKKVAEKTRRRPQGSPLAYSGTRYKKDELVPLLHATEIAIHEADVASDRKLSDHAVIRALESLIREIRKGPLPPLESTEKLEIRSGEEDAAIIQNIRRHWGFLYESRLRDPRDDQVGVLRTLIDSVETWSTRYHSTRGYLAYVEGFLKKTGVSVRVEDAAGNPIEEDEDHLLEIGREWCEGDQEAAVEFRDEIDALMRAGAAERIVEVTQRLLGEYPDAGPICAELMAMSARAQDLDRPSSR